MHICRVEIINFRNFEHAVFECGRNVVLLGENKAGKSNLLFAMRLVLDPSLPDSARKLRMEDIWDGVANPGPEDVVKISIDLTEFENDENQLALLADHLVQPEPMVARLTYVWEPRKGLKDPRKESDYDFNVYGGDRPENRIYGDLRRRLPMELLHALRDCEADLARWTRSPLRPLLDEAVIKMDAAELAEYAEKIEEASNALTEAAEIKEQAEKLDGQLRGMVGANQALDLLLRFAPIDPDRLVRSLRIFIDGGKRGVSDASLGSTNLLFFALKMLEYRQLVDEGDREHTFLAIEEPEAHLHPTLQRLVFRNYLRLRQENGDDEKLPEANVWVSTHSPHIASVAPIDGFVLLRSDGNATSAVSSAHLKLSEKAKEDLERYLDVSRGEMLFARGVILVEGDAEKFLVPVLAKAQGIDLDESGIVVCSVSGTNFGPYAKFLEALNIPYSIMTDGDPDEDGVLDGLRRAETLLEKLYPDVKWDLPSWEETDEAAAGHGIFVNGHTFEVALYECGLEQEFSSAMTSISNTGKRTERMTAWVVGVEDFDASQFLTDIEEVSKGRFAQRLAACIAESETECCPDYVKNAIKYVQERANPE